MDLSDLPARSGLDFLARDSQTATVEDSAALRPEMANGERSELIDALLNRQSVLEEGAYAQVSRAVLAANSRAAEADLRAAMLRDEARDRNWLPTLGPQVSLTSLGSVVSTLVVDQVLFDNGGKKAERAFARADVEVAAVALAQDTNDRVYQALSLYLDAQSAVARAGVTRGAMARMERLNYIMSERVRAGIDDRSDLQFVGQRLAQMRSDMASDDEAAQTAMAELSAMSAMPLAGIEGLSGARAPAANAQPLSVMKAEAEARRAVAEARAARAGFLPGATLSGSVGSNGNSMGVNVGAANGLSLSMGADMRALEAQEQVAAARTGQAREDAAREIAGLNSQLASLRRQQAEAQGLLDRARATYELFEEQLQAGQRSVPEVVGVFQTRVNAERDLVKLRYDIARIELKLAALHGALVDGEKI
ncbi:transporter [Salibaculum griseiflavum]|uniref:Transporter n=2 Tax=Salibaculum griseiflavum TaxID=1914409 RepID=A0A2V1P004_9RHOB|nr:transporter [Salibaculum griseiflavum]